jgi:hypothetical protein
MLKFILNVSITKFTSYFFVKILKKRKKMFFKIFLLFLTISSAIADDDFKGCGEDEDKARKELSSAIHVTVKSGFQKFASTIGNKIGIDETKFFSNQETNLELSGLERSEEDEKICFSISKEKLRENAETIFTEISNSNNSTEIVEKAKRGIAIAKALGDNDLIEKFSQKINSAEKESSFLSFSQIKAKIQNFAMPEDEKEAFEKLSKMISDIRNKITNSDDPEQIAFLEETKSKFQTLLGKLKLQSVIFHIEGGRNLKIFIDSDRDAFGSGEKISLQTGTHNYTIEGEDICPITGEFSLKELENIEIANIDLREHTLPQVSFSSNKSENIDLKLDGKDIALVKKHQLKKCEGTILYSATFNDGEFQDVENGEIDLKAGLDKDIFLKFISTGELKAIKNEMKSYVDGDRLEFLVSYSSTSDSETYNSDDNLEVKNFEINHMTQKRLFRYGYGFMVGVDDFDKPTTRNYELYYSFAMHFATIGKSEMPLQIAKSISFIPYFGAKVGLAYHEYHQNGETKYVFPTKEDLEDSESKTADDWKFSRDTLLFKPYIGVDFVLSKGFALKVFAEQSIYQDKRFHIGTGLSVEF